MRGCGGPFYLLDRYAVDKFRGENIAAIFFFSRILYVVIIFFLILAVAEENSCGTFTDSCFIENSADIARGKIAVTDNLLQLFLNMISECN